MPAIQPARLRQQAASLAESFNDPTGYARSLHSLMDFYSDRARRPGKTGRPGPLIQAYNVRPPVLRMLLQELLPLANQNPEAALALCDALWAEDYLEFRQLSAMLLGQLPPEAAPQVIARLQEWISPSLELHLIELLISTGVERLQREQSPTLLALIDSWLTHTRTFYQQLGLHALLPLIRNPAYENLPIFFRMIQPYARLAPPSLRPDVLDVLTALAQRSPQETAYFLRQMLGHPDSPDTPWLVRQSLPAFPEELQASLRQAVRSTDARPKRTGARP